MSFVADVHEFSTLPYWVIMPILLASLGRIHSPVIYKWPGTPLYWGLHIDEFIFFYWIFCLIYKLIILNININRFFNLSIFKGNLNFTNAVVSQQIVWFPGKLENPFFENTELRVQLSHKIFMVEIQHKTSLRLLTIGGDAYIVPDCKNSTI